MPMQFHKVLVDSKAALVTQKLEEKSKNYNQLAAQLKDEQLMVQSLK